MEASRNLTYPGIGVEDISPEATPVDELAVFQAVPPPLEDVAVLQPFLTTLSPVQPPLNTKEKCQAKGCLEFHHSPHTPVTTCSLEECTKLVHCICSKKMLSKSKKARTVHSTAVSFTFSCQHKYDKSLSTSHLHWRKMEKMDQRTQNTQSTILFNGSSMVTTLVHGGHHLVDKQS